MRISIRKDTNKYSSGGGGHFSKINKSGFTLIELLAVIIILGILMIIAIPSVTQYISSSRKSAYVATAKEYINDVRNQVNSGDIAAYEKDVTYYVPGSCVTLENSGDSPYGKFLDYYVVVTYDGNGYDYYWTSRDDANMGIYLTYDALLDEDKILPGITKISTDIGVGDRPKIKLLDNTCKVENATEKVASLNIDERGFVDGSLSEDMIGMHKEAVLNGAYPRLKSNLIPITIEDNGEVKKADTSTEWYSYENKRWANAVILKDESKTYENGETIPESDIEGYFVWIPRYRYKLWNVSNTSSSGVNTSVVHQIEIEFESTMDNPSTGSKNGEWLTHPAFTSFGVNGMWVGKFETGYEGSAPGNTASPNRVVVKPNVYSWRSIQVANAFTTSYNYQRSLDSHMMKNTEWGAVAYLSHSKYGISSSIRINNHSGYRTGYAAVSEPTVDWPEYKGYGTSASVTQPWNTATGYLASTTGNITGIYDMSGGAWEYVMGVQVDSEGLPLSGRHNVYNSGFNGTLGCPTCDINVEKPLSGVNSSITKITNGTPLPSSKYYDAYKVNSNGNRANRILGDATGELGPFGTVTATGTTEQCGETGKCSRNVSSWYSDNAWFVYSGGPWFSRGGYFSYVSGAGVFGFGGNGGYAVGSYSFRVVLAF